MKLRRFTHLGKNSSGNIICLPLGTSLYFLFKTSPLLNISLTAIIKYEQSCIFHQLFTCDHLFFSQPRTISLEMHPSFLTLSSPPASPSWAFLLHQNNHTLSLRNHACLVHLLRSTPHTSSLSLFQPICINDCPFLSAVHHIQPSTPLNLYSCHLLFQTFPTYHSSNLLILH